MHERIGRVVGHLPHLIDADPGQVIADPGQAPYWRYGPELRAFLDDVVRSGLLIPFDWVSWQGTAKRLEQDPAALAEADLDTLRRLLTLHVRASRFQDGHMAQVLSSGLLAAILRRLEQVMREMDRCDE